MKYIIRHPKSFIFGLCVSFCLPLLNVVFMHFQVQKNTPQTVLASDNVVAITQTPSPIPTQIPTDTPTPKPTRVPTKKPTPTLRPTPIKITNAELENLFEKAANHYSIEKQKLRNLAYCESRFNPNATNGIYGGLYQFSSSTWNSTRRAMNQDPNPTLRFNPEDAINTAAFKISTSGLSAWPHCSKQ